MQPSSAMLRRDRDVPTSNMVKAMEAVKISHGHRASNGYNPNERVASHLAREARLPRRSPGPSATPSPTTPIRGSSSSSSRPRTSSSRASTSSPATAIGHAPSTFATTRRGAARVHSSNRDLEKWQFWPNFMAMGSLTGNRFTEMFGARCKHGADPESKSGYGFSYLAFDFKRELLVIKAQFKQVKEVLPPAFLPFDAELPFSDISKRGIHVVTQAHSLGGVILTVTATCRRPPRFFAVFEDQKPEMVQYEKTRGGNVYRRRATAIDFVLSKRFEKDSGIIRSVPENVANPTFWNTYQWKFRLDSHEADMFNKCCEKLRMLAEDNPEMMLMSENHAGWHHKRRPDTDWDFPDLLHLDFGTRALIEGLVGYGILIPVDVLPLTEALRKYAPGVRFRKVLLESLFTEERIRNPERLLSKRAEILRRETEFRNLDHLVMIRTVQLTPTRVLVAPPQQETSNSVTRKYKDKLDGIIRVQFVDEGDRLHILDYTKHADEINQSVGLMARIRRALQHGVMIAGQRFYPVASSSSQQKEHSMWFVNHDVIDRVALARWMGMPKERVVAKYAARMGLPFSASRQVPITAAINRWKDIEHDGHCFTDGCSIAGPEVMKMAAEALGARGLNATPSAIQFRLAGAKGVLACWPDKVGQNEILLRPSQEKFVSKLMDLNVIRVAHYQVAFLNRQFIMIMSANGVPDQLFMDLFLDAIATIKGLAERVYAGTPTQQDLIFMGIYTSFPLQSVVKYGFHQNVFVQDICRLIECRALQDLKWRARIKLPGGVYLIGISDESGLLKEGELFCQYQENENTAAKVVSGRVLICRAPALHPGDVRLATAIDVPELHHLKNVIVFNTAGRRPLPNMLGGGDLDGDDYTLIWDQRFVEPLIEHEPMDYTAPPPLTVEKVTQLELNENFVQYILNDVLGQVDNAHLANSDLRTPFHDVCMTLSNEHSKAVDFAKTGVAVKIDPDWFPRKWPDFMGKDEDKTYRSEKILGQLFRLVDPGPAFEPTDITEQTYPEDPMFDSIKVSKELLDALRPIKAQYEQAMTYTMRRYRVEEVEVVAGLATQTKSRKRSRQLSHLKEPLKDAFDAHTHDTRARAHEAVMEAAKEHRLRLNSIPHIVAMHAYILTYKEEYVQDRAAVHLLLGVDEMDALKPAPMLSFAWVWAEELVDYAQHLKAEARKKRANGV